MSEKTLTVFKRLADRPISAFQGSERVQNWLLELDRIDLDWRPDAQRRPF